MRSIILIMITFVAIGLIAFFVSSPQVGYSGRAYAVTAAGSGGGSSSSADCAPGADSGKNSITNCQTLNSPKPNLDTFTNLAKQAIQFALIVAGALATIVIIIGGIRYIISRGDPNEITGAKHILQYAILGLLVIIFSYAAITILVHTFN